LQKKKPHRRSDEALMCDDCIDYSFTPIHRARTPPYFLTPCVQIVLTTYKQRHSTQATRFRRTRGPISLQNRIRSGWYREGNERGPLMTPRLLRIQEVSERTGLSKHTLYKMVSQCRIPYTKLGGALRFDPEKLDQWIKQSTVMPMRQK